jgi:hypothetical protein
MVEVGEKNKLVTFAENLPAPQGAGYDDVFNPIVTTWGRLRKVSGRRGLEEGERFEQARWELICDIETALIPTLEMIVVLGSDAYTIDSVEKLEEFEYRLILTSKNGTT